MTWDRSGGRHLPFSSQDNTEEETEGHKSEFTENELGLKGYYPQSVESYIPDLQENIPIAVSSIDI